MPLPADQYVSQYDKSWRQFIVWLMLAVSAVFVLALIFAAPVSLAANHSQVALVIYRGFSKVCHQLPERSFFLAGHPLAVCARCTGLYAGFTVALVAYPLVFSLKRTYAPPRRWLFMAAAPMAIDVSLTLFGIWENTHTSRLVTGTLLGAAAVFYIMPGVSDLALHGWRFETPRPIANGTIVSAPVPTAPSDYCSPHHRI